MQDDEAAKLIKKYQAGTCTEQEKALIENWYRQTAGSNQGDISPDELETILAEIWDSLPVHDDERKVRSMWPRIAAAASILIVLSAGGYFLLHKKQPPQQIAQNQVHDIKPGGNKAILTLGNGQQISLTDAKSGLVAQQSGMQIKKTAGGTVVYVADNAAAVTTTAVVYNTITNPKGGASAWIELPDGSKVMLDAASSIKYPVPFAKNERLITLTGEAFFEPVHNAAAPFRVSAKNQITEDIGTQFNINAYDDEPVVKTTLVEGSIQVAANGGTVTLKPGQQAVVGGDASIRLIKDADLEEALAWKNGVFVFDNTTVPEIMKQIARWYNADIVYDGNFGDQQYSGSVSRYSNVSDVLKIMQSTGAIHFKIEERRITVMP